MLRNLAFTLTLIVDALRDKVSEGGRITRLTYDQKKITGWMSFLYHWMIPIVVIISGFFNHISTFLVTMAVAAMLKKTNRFAYIGYLVLTYGVGLTVLNLINLVMPLALGFLLILMVIGAYLTAGHMWLMRGYIEDMRSTTFMVWFGVVMFALTCVLVVLFNTDTVTTTLQVIYFSQLGLMFIMFLVFLVVLVRRRLRK